ncbi:FTR1 family protein [Virgisporangium ochraceum]|uniref:Iron transporter n=1 Tax=Virgisporangium ochraceum TaxID=65505 RepID=A0A8J4A065_9ACTN|nr:iron uptake transporter permease EfeU [Virgisporangium ochraceum]GIJ73444.1 iron transporter [Virgisporangium ochraceum]
MTASYLIGLREGLEATLVVSILVAFLVKSGQRGYLRYVWAGVAAAVALSVGFGALLTYTSAHLTFEQGELFEAVASVAAVCFVTWMIFWMRRMARRIAGDLRGKLAEAIRMGPVAVVVMAFLSVAREGLETALLFFSAVQGATSSAGPLLAIIGGIATAVVIGVVMYAGAVRVNLGKFFTWTGVLLVLVAAGILKYGVHDFQEAGALPGLNDLAYDFRGVWAPDAWYSALLTGMFNITPSASVLEVVAWVAYAVPVLVLFLLPQRPAAAPTTATTATPAPAAPTPE